MAGPLVAALGVHIALAALALNVRPRVLPAVIEAPVVLLVPVVAAAMPMADVPIADVLVVDDPAATAPPLDADPPEPPEPPMPEGVPQPIAAPPARVAAPSRPAVARAPARVSAPMIAPAAAPGTASAVAMAEPQRAAPDAEVVAAWRAALSAWVEQNRRYPPLARFRQEEGVVQVRFELDPGGRVLRVDVQRESGSAALDAAAVALLTGATLPAPPRELAPGLRVVTLPIRYRLQ